MSFPARIGLVLAIVGSLVAVATLVRTQVPQQFPVVLSGNDIGFQVDSRGRDGIPTGKLLVRIDGKWVEAQFSTGIRRLGST